MPAALARNLTIILALLAALALAWAIGHPALAGLWHTAMHYHGGPHVTAMHFHG